MLCTVVVLGVAATILGGYYYYAGNDLLAATAPKEMPSKTPEPTDRNAALQIRGGALWDEQGNIDPNGVANAIAQRDLYMSQHMPPDGFGDKGVDTGTGRGWQPRGPHNLGGRTETILLHPDFGNAQSRKGETMWAGGASGGIWISNDAGKTWNAANGVLGNFNVSCLALDPGDTTGNTLYAGTGAHDLHGDGIFRSTNGGLEWKRLDHGHNNGWKYVSSISVARINDNTDTVILAAVDNDSNDPAAENGIMRGVITPNDPQGTWQEVQDGTYGIAVGFDPNDSLKAVASVCYEGIPADPDGKCKAYYSTQRGEPGTWYASQLGSSATAVPAPLFESPRANDTIQFAFQKSAPGSVGPTAIYAQYGDNVTTVLSKSTNGGAYFSTHGLGGNPGINRGVPAFWVSPPAIHPPGYTDSPVVIAALRNASMRSASDEFFSTCVA